MRTVVGVALVTVCLGLAGCSLFGKNKAARKDNSKPFLGSEAPAKTDTAAAPRDSGLPPGANGVLAGRVVVESTEQPIKAYIWIKSRDQENDKGADLDISTNEEGYFTIPNLKAGGRYALVVRANENGELISRTIYPTAPNPTLWVELHKRWTTASTPPPPDMPNFPERKKSTAGAGSPKDTKPAVSIDPPVKLDDQGAQPRGGIAAPAPAGGSSLNPVGGAAPNPANIAEGGFRRMAQPSETISIPPPPPQPPSQPQWESVPGQPQPIQAAPPGSVRMPAIQTPVPSCGLYGNHLDNFALYDLDGKAWEYKRDRGPRTRLMLLDFWYSSCHHCLLDIPNLVELQREYGKYGLEIVGIACEMGSVEEQRRNVRPMCVRYGVNYRTLLSGGKDCPVMAQFQVEYYPLLVLIDSDGTILWRSTRDGMHDRAHYALRKMIDDRLVTRQSQP